MQMKEIIIKNKKAKLITDEPIGLIIAVGALVIISILIGKLLFSPNADTQAQKSFFSNLKSAVNILPGQKSEFIIWGNEKIYAVYFGTDYLSTIESPQKILFRAKHNFERAFCICLKSDDKVEGYLDGGYFNAKCNYCFNLPGEIKNIITQDKEDNVINSAPAYNTMHITVSSGEKILFSRYNDNNFDVTRIVEVIK